MELSFNQSYKAIAIFLLITFGLSSIFYFLIIHIGKLGSGFGIYVTGIMWCPALSALITTKILNRKISGLAWQWGKPRYQLWAYLIPLIYALIAYLIIWMVGWGRFGAVLPVVCLVFAIYFWSKRSELTRLPGLSTD